jgi:hypothetical protein
MVLVEKRRQVLTAPVQSLKVQVGCLEQAKVISSNQTFQLLFILKCILKLLEVINRSISLVIKLTLVFSNPNPINNRPKDSHDWDQPPNQGRGGA